MQPSWDEWVFRAQAGDSEASLYLLESFGWRAEGPFQLFLGKYERLLRFGRIDLRDKDTRRFLQLYASNASLKAKLALHYQDYAASMYAQSLADYLQEKAGTLDPEELRQELALIFLELVQCYRKQKKQVDFSGYLYNVFRFRVYAFLDKRLFRFDGLHHPLLCPEEEIIDEASEIIVSEAWFDRFYASEMDREELGLFWINGRCGSLFKPLSVFERIVLRDHDFHGLSDKAIAKRYGFHINTIHKTRHRAMQKLKRELSEN